MIDKISIRPDRLYLRTQAVLRNTTAPGFKRQHALIGICKPYSAVFQIPVNDKYPVLTLVAGPTAKGRWLVKKIDFCPASLLYGHNARALLKPDDLHLALSRLRQFVAPIVEERCLGRVVPGTEDGSLTYIKSVELTAQFEDDDHEFLRASHFATRPRQQNASMVQYGAYTKIPGREIGIRIYDKATKYSKKNNSTACGQSTRAEIVLKNPVRLAKCFPQVIGEDCSGSPVMKTISFADCYRSLRRELLALTGFGSVLDQTKAGQKMHKAAMALFIGLGDKVADPTEVSRALHEYKVLADPCPKTFRQVCKSLRATVVGRLYPSVMEALPESLEDFRGCDIERRDVEIEFQKLLETFHCTETADRDIVEAWAHSTYLEEEPKFTDVFRKKTVGIEPQLGSLL
jgi:hypothetical protein